jgi:hypothetical protein
MSIVVYFISRRDVNYYLLSFEVFERNLYFSVYEETWNGPSEAEVHSIPRLTIRTAFRNVCNTIISE